MTTEFREILEISQQHKVGLTFYLGGQVVHGYVTKIQMEAQLVEVRNQTHDRVLIRMERVDALAMP